MLRVLKNLLILRYCFNNSKCFKYCDRLLFKEFFNGPVSDVWLNITFPPKILYF